MEHCIFFVAPVEPRPVGELLRHVREQQAKGTTKIHLAISSYGGHSRDGFACHYGLQSSGVEVVTYNLSNVETAAVPIFLTGSERIMFPNSSITVHRPKRTFKEDSKLDVNDAFEIWKTLLSDTVDLADILAKRTGTTKDNALEMVRDSKVMDPKDAVELGFATKVELAVFPVDMPTTSIRF